MKAYLWILGAGLLFLAGCGKAPQQIKLEASGYQIRYQGNVSWVARETLTETPNDIVALYTESGANSTYQDSLLLAEKYNQGKGVVVFSQEAIDTVKAKGLTLANERDEKFSISCQGEKKSVHLIAYAITSGFVQKVPKLYMTQLFWEKDANTLLLWSHSTENHSEQDAIRAAFQTLQCSS
ncbi:MAG: hypothetical protein LBU27_03470 [Candidatus Peribacteria bacterium]|jgi:hypothetical protein|nr:hypothetical protein [Candidatus Peribacteria bacterium]